MQSLLDLDNSNFTIVEWRMSLYWFSFSRNSNGIMMTEYNPNYEFAGGTCTLQDLREVDRDNLILVKYVTFISNSRCIHTNFAGHLVREPLERCTKGCSRVKMNRQRPTLPWKLFQNSPQTKVKLIFPVGLRLFDAHGRNLANFDFILLSENNLELLGYHHQHLRTINLSL